MAIYSSMTDEEVLRAVLANDDPTVRELARRLEARIDETEDLEGEIAFLEEQLSEARESVE